jgi:Helix-turn-helix domain
MTKPNDPADELIRRAYADAPLPSFDVSAGLADMHTRIKESGLLSTPTRDRDPRLGLRTANVANSAPGGPGPAPAAQNPDKPRADTGQIAASRRVATRITGNTRDKLAADLKKKYERGASIRALAESTGRSYGFIHRVLSESGVQLRGRGDTTRTRKSKRRT